MKPEQEKAALALVAATLSRDGFQKAMAIVDADQVLETRALRPRADSSRIRFGRAEYYVAILGKPSATDPWMIQFGGHHLAINVTLAGAANVLAPTHTGTQPASYSVEGRTIRPLGDENDKAFALVNALSADQQKQADPRLRRSATSCSGPAPTARRSRPKASAPRRSRPRSATMLVGLVREWVDILGAEAAAAKMKEVQAGLAETYFAWAGPDDQRQGRVLPDSGADAADRVRAAGPGRTTTPITFTRSTATRPTTTRPRRPPSMRRRFAAAIVVVLSMPADTSAHRLDEYLQATRLSLTRDHLVLEVDLAPGTMLAPELVGAIDTDRSGTISPEEAERYGRSVLAEVMLAVDGKTAAPALTGVEVPSIEELRDGTGAIRIRASSDRLDVPSGRVRLYFRNDHRPAASVYLVNALLPRDAGVRVLGQTRDGPQREAWIDYDIAPRSSSTRLAWFIAGLGGLPIWLAVQAARRDQRGGAGEAAGLTRRITRRYEVSDGVPLSSTARMTCAMPATSATTSVFAPVGVLHDDARRRARAGPAGADGMPPSFWLPPPPTGARPAATTGCLGMPVPASG